MEVAVVQPEVAEAGPDVVICDVDTSLSFVDFTPATSGAWSGPGVSNSGTGAVNAGPLTPGTYTYTYEYGTGTCFSSDTRQLTVLERPVLTLSAADLTVCTGEEASFAASVSGGAGPLRVQLGQQCDRRIGHSHDNFGFGVDGLDSGSFCGDADGHRWQWMHR